MGKFSGFDHGQPVPDRLAMEEDSPDPREYAVYEVQFAEDDAKHRYRRNRTILVITHGDAEQAAAAVRRGHPEAVIHQVIRRSQSWEVVFDE